MELMVERLAPLAKQRDEIVQSTGALPCKYGCTFWKDVREKSFYCSSADMCLFGIIGRGDNSTVRRAIHIPTHRVMAVKEIHLYETEKRRKLFEDVRWVCDSPSYEGLVEYYGVYYPLDSGGISIAMEYVNGGSLADILRKQKFIHEPDLCIVALKLLEGLISIHRLRHEMHLNLKPSNFIFDLNGEAKVTDYGISEELHNNFNSMCATSDVLITYMSPERINKESYWYPADMWSFGLIMMECGTGEFPYNASQGTSNLMLQIRCDPHPLPPRYPYSCEYRSFVESCLRKDPECRWTSPQLLQHRFIRRYENEEKYIDLPSTIRSHFDPNQRFKDLGDMLSVHYYMLFDGPEKMWPHMKTFYREKSAFSFATQVAVGVDRIFSTLNDIRNLLAGEWFGGKIVHVVESMECCPFAKGGIMIRVSGVLVIGSHFIPLGEVAQVEGMAGCPSLDSQRRRLATFSEKFLMLPAELRASFYIIKQELEVEPSSPVLVKTGSC